MCSPSNSIFHIIHIGLTLIFRSAVGALIMEITYGIDTKYHKDEFLQTAEHALEHVEKAMVPGAFLVDTFPIRSSTQ